MGILAASDWCEHLARTLPHQCQVCCPCPDGCFVLGGLAYTQASRLKFPAANTQKDITGVKHNELGEPQLLGADDCVHCMPLPVKPGMLLTPRLEWPAEDRAAEL